MEVAHSEICSRWELKREDMVPNISVELFCASRMVFRAGNLEIVVNVGKVVRGRRDWKHKRLGRCRKL